MRAALFALAFVSAFDPVFLAPALAAEPCGPRTELLAALGSRYTEAPVAVGLTSEGGLLEVLSGQDGSTWTIMLSNPHGMSCLIAAGESWQAVEWKAPAGGIEQ